VGRRGIATDGIRSRMKGEERCTKAKRRKGKRKRKRGGERRHTRTHDRGSVKLGKVPSLRWHYTYCVSVA
jgi:hypothetical protein